MMSTNGVDMMRKKMAESRKNVSDFKYGEITLVNILGEIYTVKIKDRKNCERLERTWGFTDHTSKEIVITSLEDAEKTQNIGDKPIEVLKQTLRHETIHAFLFESGLFGESYNNEPWAVNEEMIDWLAIQGPKIIEVWDNLFVI